MANVLHLVKEDAALAVDVIMAQVAGGDAVTVAVLEGAVPALPARVTVRRLDIDLTYPQLVDLIFDADQVIPW